jgi:translation initiation factor IF-3
VSEFRELRVNRRIRVPQVRLLGSDGSQLGIVNTADALKKAQEEDLDLVEISPAANPPVCKLIDYGKYKYIQKKRAQEAKKKQIVIHLKEVKLRPTTDEHDFQFKMRHLQRFLEEGNKAKITIVFRGREVAYSSLGRNLMDRIVGLVKDKAKIESSPRMEGKAMIMVLAPS